MNHEPQSPADELLPSWMAPRPKELPTPLPAMQAPRTPVPESLEIAPEEAPACGAPEVPAKPAPPPDPTEPLRMRVADLEATVAHLRAALDGAIEGTTRLRRAWIDECEPELVRLAVAIARRVVSTELKTDPSLVVTWAREALEVVVGAGPRIAIGHEVARHVDVEAWRTALGEVTIEVDPELPVSAVEVRAGDARVQTCARARVQAVAASLGIEGLGDDTEAK